jgi:hypothetical protein
MTEVIIEAQRDVAELILRNKDGYLLVQVAEEHAWRQLLPEESGWPREQPRPTPNS